MTRASDILKEVSLFESFFTGFDDFKNPVTYGVEKRSIKTESEESHKLYLSQFISNGKLSYTVIYGGQPLMRNTTDKNAAIDFLKKEAAKLRTKDIYRVWDGDKGNWIDLKESRLPVSEAKEKKELSVYIEIDNGGKITRMDTEAFRKAVGGAHTGFAQDWVDKYNKDKGSKMARLVYAKNGKEIGKKVESIKERSSDAIKMKPDDEKKIALLKASLLNTPLAKKKEVTAQIDSIKAKYESRSLKTETVDFINGSFLAEAGEGDAIIAKIKKLDLPLVKDKDSPSEYRHMMNDAIDKAERTLRVVKHAPDHFDFKKEYREYKSIMDDLKDWLGGSAKVVKDEIQQVIDVVNDVYELAFTGYEDYKKLEHKNYSLKTETSDFIKGSIFEAGGWDSPTRKMAIATNHGMGDEVLKIVAEFKKKYPDSVEKIVKMPKMVVIKFKFRSVADSLGPVRELKNSLADIGVDRMMTKIESVMEGGPGSGGQYPTQKMKMPLSPFISVGTRKGILKNMPFEIETVPLSKITHVAQRKFVPFKVKNLCKSPDGISKKPICLLKVPSEDAYHVMDGHHRYLAAMKKGMDSLDAKVWVKFEEPKVDEPIAEEPPVANDIDLDAIPSGEPDLVPAEAEAIDVTIDGEPASIEGAPSEEIPAMDTPPASNVTLDDAPLTATDPLLPVDAPLEDELDQPIEAMSLDQALESMDRCGQALLGMR